MTPEQTILNFVQFVVSQLCPQTDDISIESVQDERGQTINIRVAEEDMGRLIGRSGQTIRALRLLVRSMGARMGLRTTLKVVEDESADTSFNDTDLYV